MKNVPKTGFYRLNTNQKNSGLEKVKKNWSKTKKEPISMQNSSHTFARCIKPFSFSLYNQFFGKILEHESFQVKAGTLSMHPILEDIQINHKA